MGEAVAAFKQSVDEVQTIIETSKEALRRKEEERHARSELAEKLKLLDQSIRHIVENEQVKTGVIKEIADRRVWKCLCEFEELSSNIAALGMHSEDLELKEFEARVNDFELEVSEKVNDFNDSVETSRQERKEKFRKTFAMFEKDTVAEKP